MAKKTYGVEEHGVHMQEVGVQESGCLAGQELSPGGCLAWCGRRARRRPDPPDRSCADAVPEAEELTLNAPVSPPAGSAWPTARRVDEAPPGPAGVRWRSVGPLVLDDAPGARRAGCRVPRSSAAESAWAAAARARRVAAQSAQSGSGRVTSQRRTADPGPQHQDLHVLQRAAAREQRRPAEQPVHKQVRRRRARVPRMKPRSDAASGYRRFTGQGIDKVTRIAYLDTARELLHPPGPPSSSSSSPGLRTGAEPGSSSWHG